MSKTEAAAKIKEFFGRESFSPDELRKIRALAMKFSIKLGAYRRLYCKSCLSQLKGSTRISRGHKTVTCAACGTPNKFKIK
jgi:RNase P subunit RPR2